MRPLWRRARADLARTHGVGPLRKENAAGYAAWLQVAPPQLRRPTRPNPYTARADPHLAGRWCASGDAQAQATEAVLGLGHCAFLPSGPRLRLPLAVPRSGPVVLSLWRRARADLARIQVRATGSCGTASGLGRAPHGGGREQRELRAQSAQRGSAAAAGRGAAGALEQALLGGEVLDGGVRHRAFVKAALGALVAGRAVGAG